MKSKILYFLVWGITVYLGVLYYSPSLMALTVLEFLLPIFSRLLLWYTARKVRAFLYLPIGVAEKNQPVSVGIGIENKSWIPVSAIRGSMRVRNGFYPGEETIPLRGMAEGKGNTRMLSAVSSSHCGPLLVEVPELWMYDLFRIFKRKLPVRGVETLAVMPEMYTASVILQESTRDFLIESEEYDKKRAGDDPAEIFQIREYRGGDRMQSIHWKLSARTDDLMVKEYSKPIGCAVVLFLDMEYQPEEGCGYLDEFLEAGIGISQGLLEAGCEHYVVWFDKNAQDIRRLRMKEKDDSYLLIEKIFSAGPYTEPMSLEEIYREKYRGETWHTQLLLNLKKELWKNGSLEMDLAGQAREILEREEMLI
ncbi:MAG: DUF58 domain-containing protein [Clostridiales bacterium]|nr:DUF58 domain-containing protein [Clostridiales bacterium]